MTTSNKKSPPRPETRKEIGLVPLPEEVLLSVMANQREITRMSCSPFQQEELVTGWLFAQGLIDRSADIEELAISADVARVRLAAKVSRRIDLYSRIQVQACSGGDIHPELFEKLPLLQRRYNLDLPILIQLMQELPSQARMFQKHGGIHCSLLVDILGSRILAAREDIGRSNSMDKVIGFGLIQGICFSDTALFTTGRISAEMTLKTLRAGIPSLVSQTTCTSKALEIARKTGLAIVCHVLKPRPILINF